MLEVLVLAIPAAIAAMVARRYWWLTRIRSWSMYPTLHPADCVPARKLNGAAPIRRGDIVIIGSAKTGRRLVKRVIGLPGETVDVGQHGVTIDGVLLAEPYVAAHGGPTGSFCVPAHAYVVLGDNRPRSSDSRSWTTPFVAVTAIRGRLIGPPLNRLRRRVAPVAEFPCPIGEESRHDRIEGRGPIGVLNCPHEAARNGSTSLSRPAALAGG